jgi:hypothetical protein
MAAKRSSGGEEVVNHFGAVRLRVNGSASLLMTLFSLDEQQSDVLFPVPLSSVTDVEPNRLANLTQQRAKLQIKTTRINETFQISKIVIFIRPVAKSWPETS